MRSQSWDALGASRHIHPVYPRMSYYLTKYGNEVWIGAVVTSTVRAGAGLRFGAVWDHRKTCLGLPVWVSLFASVLPFPILSSAQGGIHQPEA